MKEKGGVFGDGEECPFRVLPPISHDGGYYLIGTNKMQYKLFQDISWSTERVVTQTLAIVNSLGLSYHLLPNLIDIDTADDLRLWQKRNAGAQG
jgi:hypothetical protein